MELHLPLIYGFALVLLRTTALFFAAPVLSARSVPPRIRLGLALFVALASFSGAGTPTVVPPESFTSLIGAAFSETALGVVAGLSARLVLEAALAAGQLVGLSAGLGFGATVDPIFGAESGAVGQLLSMAALGFAVALGLHREAIGWLAESVRQIPPGSPQDLHTLASTVIRQALYSATLAVRLAFPLWAATLLAHLGLGLAGRTAPQLNLTTIGFTLSMLAGGGALYVGAPTMAHLVAQAAANSLPPL